MQPVVAGERSEGTLSLGGPFLLQPMLFSRASWSRPPPPRRRESTTASARTRGGGVVFSDRFSSTPCGGSARRRRRCAAPWRKRSRGGRAHAPSHPQHSGRKRRSGRRRARRSTCSRLAECLGSRRRPRQRQDDRHASPKPLLASGSPRWRLGSQAPPRTGRGSLAGLAKSLGSFRTPGPSGGRCRP